MVASFVAWVVTHLGLPDPGFLELITLEETPMFMRNNTHILSGYRGNANTIPRALSSLGVVHNETFNVFSHGLGAVFLGLFAAGVAGGVVGPPVAGMSLGGVLAWAAFLAGAQGVLWGSATMHALHCHSAQVHHAVSCLDYLGIAAFCGGCTTSMVYYVLLDHPVLATLYCVTVSVLCMAVMALSSMARFCTPAYRLVRVGTFTGLAVFSAAPIAHLYLVDPSSHIFAHLLPPLTAEYAVFIAGGLLYGFRIPERFSPGSFDLFGNGHNILHIAVLIGIYVHYHLLSSLHHVRVSSAPHPLHH